MSLIHEGVELHAETLTDPAVAGEEVTYKRGTSTVEVWATLGKTDWDEVTGGDTGDAYFGNSATDFLIRRSKLVLGGKRIQPRRGDVVVRADGSEYGVMPGINSVPSEPNDGRENLVRIHTQKRKRSNQ